ncbi:hypothetical protein PsB1_0922 [Candidatus Phycosocius spiralis]|uniref:DUF218 domain-containing protein n=1 Tax=Candidatus Phycosocius spiralis TaxID=2815099 RepID=A0ABQ4PVT2_9PROT|nr:hypothetical protein PsB1_0922 [Candidatus Phycosocius spiralis]
MFGLVCGLGLLIGFVRFGDHVATLMPPVGPIRADGAAALTGGSDQRLIAGVQLVENGSVPHLLISGVNSTATEAELRRVAGGQQVTYDCCIDLGRRAVDTSGNAQEAALWVKKNNIQTLVVITDAYHMPRSLYEIRRAIPNVVLIAYPVQANHGLDGDWWKQDRTTRAFALEYGKYLVAIARGFMDGDRVLALKQISLVKESHNQQGQAHERRVQKDKTP